MIDKHSINLDYWTAFITGDDQALHELYQRTVDELFSFGCRISADPETVKDAIHDLFIDLMRYRENLDRQVKVIPYLYSSLRRKLIAALRRNIALESLEEDRSDDGFTFEWDAEAIMIQHEEQRALYAKLKEALAKLSARQREALYLRFHSELSYEETSSILEISVASCRTLVYRAVKQLREALETKQTPMSSIWWMLFGKKN